MWGRHLWRTFEKSTEIPEPLLISQPGLEKPDKWMVGEKELCKLTEINELAAESLSNISWSVPRWNTELSSACKRKDRQCGFQVMRKCFWEFWLGSRMSMKLVVICLFGKSNIENYWNNTIMHSCERNSTRYLFSCLHRTRIHKLMKLSRSLPMPLTFWVIQ